MLQADKDQLVELLAKQAANAEDAKDYFKDLVRRADLPDRWKRNLAGVWRGNANMDARFLVDWAIAKGVNPNNRNFATLGSLVQPFLTDLGFDDAIKVAALVAVYELYRGKNLESLRIHYQIPVLVSSELSGDVPNLGPEFNWHGPTDREELQSFFKPVPEFLDVGFLQELMKHTACVCLVELPSQRRTGTAFLVADDLILTSYHVLKNNQNEDINANARDIQLRFGYFTAPGGREMDGQVFKLADRQPIIACSSGEELDFVLLRVEEGVTKAPDLRPVEYDLNLPGENAALNILQHPNGAAMKVALSKDGITGVYPNVARVQYVTRTAGSSSGSPCFNDDWRVVARHRAERSRSFGTIREGVLFGAIHDEIAKYL
jgi:hypothetical protein